MRLAWSELRRMPGSLMVVGVVLLGVLNFHCSTVTTKPNYIPREQVWREVQREAARHDLDPRFVYAIVAAESSFNAHAHNQQARGLMQLTPPAWEDATDLPYRRAWNWRTNISVGTAYLAYLKQRLESDGRFSYPLLAASYRYGYGAVQRAGFDMNQLPSTRNKIYRELNSGRIDPVPPPI